jgi:HSP20 family protein
MTGLTRWNPFREMDALQKRLDTYFNLDTTRHAHGDGNAAAYWAPLVDITEDDKEYVIKAELPEVNKGDVKVVVENGVLTISGERKLEKEVENKKFRRLERAYGSFVRSFTVPEDADDTKVSADFQNGLLTVRLLKQEKARPRSVEVKVA